MYFFIKDKNEVYQKFRNGKEVVVIIIIFLKKLNNKYTNLTIIKKKKVKTLVICFI